MSRALQDEKAAISQAIEALIERLDELDGDPDLEPDCDAEFSGDEREPNCNLAVFEGLWSHQGVDQ